MTTIEIEGVVITPTVHESLKFIQEVESFPDALTRIESYILSEAIPYSDKEILEMVRDLRFLKKTISKLIPSEHEPD